MREIRGEDLMTLGVSERPSQAIEDFSAGILRGLVALPKDVTGTTTLLASSESDYMTVRLS
jgi:meso-butanediol dehydrogenase/(S,S)-butanediol dehydrogenase/diacetyl reductase